MQKPYEELQDKLAKIKKTFNVKNALSIKPTTRTIAKYYHINKFAYSLFHNKKGFVHMGISRHGKYREADLLEQIILIEKYISKIKGKKILELGAGKGANSIYLARKYPNIQFDAIDLPNGQFNVIKSNTVSNFSPKEGDYHNLQIYPNDYFDLVFVIEALCHSDDKEKVFSEVKRVLKKNGIFAIFDGYLGKTRSSLTKDQLLACQLTEKGMQIGDFEYYPNVKQKLLKAGFKDVCEEDVSLLIMPTLKRFEKEANILFSMPRLLAQIILAIFPHEFTNNALSGYLMPTLIRSEVAKYMVLIIKKL
jgi:ubiquinone/menaquinone biosynthesis C-methylase UbiE